MDLEGLMNRYLRLRRELSTAYQAQTWCSDHINRLADQIDATEREIAAGQSLDEHSDESCAGLTHEAA